ncbi:MAG: hypothetical protein ACRDZ3_04910 [Acidimicrobiia bacterium]
MSRPGLMFGLAALAAVVLPLPALADGPVTATGSVHEAASEEIPFILGGRPCSLIPVPAAEDPAPVMPGSCPGVRPGGRVVSSIGECTFNFLFRAPEGTRYMGTAGHCVDAGGASPKDSNADGKGRIERIWSWGDGPLAENSLGERIGEFVYMIVHTPKDFALIRLDPGVEASAEMCHFGAPHGVLTTDTTSPVMLRYYGDGVGAGGVAFARSAVALGTPDPDHIYATGLALPGDSGAGVMTADGLAAGVLVTTGFHGISLQPTGPYQTPSPRDPPHAGPDGVDMGTVGITRLGPQLSRAVEKLGVPLELVTAE